MADEAPKKPSLRIIGDLTNAPELKESLAAIAKLKLKGPVLPDFRAIQQEAIELRVPESIEIPPHPSVRTTTAVQKLNQTMHELIEVTKAEAESVKASNRRLVRLAVVTMILTAFVAALTLVLVLR